MSYGIVPESKGNGSKMKPGVNDCKIESIKLNNIKTERYSGSVLDIMVKFDGGGERNIRVFPVNKASIHADIQNRPQSYMDTNGRVKNVEEVASERSGEITLFVKHIVTGYVHEDVWNTAIKNWITNLNGKAASFESFVTTAISLLPPHYPSIPAKILVGYVAKSEYYDLPNGNKAYTWRNLNWFSTDLFPRELSSDGGKYFKMEKFGVVNSNSTTEPDNDDTPF